MDISIRGTGNMASGLAALLAKAGHKVTVASRDPAKARAKVAELGNGVAGFKPVEAGGLATARYLEPVAGLNISLGHGLGHGTDIAPIWQGIA